MRASESSEFGAPAHQHNVASKVGANLKVINVDDSVSGDYAESFPLRKGRQRLAQVPGGDYGVARKAVIQLILNGRCVGTATNFSIDEHDELHGLIRLDEDL